MRLLERTSCDDNSISLTEDFLDPKAHAYAILSHTWGPEEVSFQALIGGTGKQKLGYRKIQFCSNEAWRHGLRFCWVDTCCINRANNTELQEAINSMFRWYQNAAKCLSARRFDPSFGGYRQIELGNGFPEEQELIAPRSVEFYSKEGVRIGDRDSLESEIHDITGIPVEALRGRPLPSFGISERFAWMEKRQTLRKEDKAYSLLGIFSIHMPLIYGEREVNSFRRLREEVDKASATLTVATHRCKLGQVVAGNVDAALKENSAVFRKDLDYLLDLVTSLPAHWNAAEFRSLIERFSDKYSLGMNWDDTAGIGYDEGLYLWNNRNQPMMKRLQGGYARLFIHQNGGDHAVKILWVQTLMAILLYIGED